MKLKRAILAAVLLGMVGSVYGQTPDATQDVRSWIEQVQRKANETRPSRSSVASDAPVPLTTTDLIVDGGFEAGTSPSGTTGYSGVSGPWVWTSTTGLNPVYYGAGTSIPPRTGSWYATLTGLGHTNTQTMYQQIAIPSGATASLTFWLLVGTLEYVHSTHDSLAVQILNSSGGSLATLATYWDRDDTGLTWIQKTFDLSSFAGQTIRLNFRNSEDISNATIFFVDDVSLVATTSGGGPCGDAQTLCLQSNRFKVRASFLNYDGTTHQGGAVKLGEEAGYFWSTDSSSIEVFLKIVNFCSLNGTFSVYGAGATDVGVTLTITDTTYNVTKTYTNPRGRDFIMVKDAPFACQTPLG